jgi:hypothetical protein
MTPTQQARPGASSPSPLLDDAIAEMLDQRVVARARAPGPPTCTIFAIPKDGTKCAIICDLRFVNGQSQFSAHSTKLSNIRDIHLSLLRPRVSGDGPRFFARLDISRYYDSIILPHHHLVPSFTFLYRDMLYEYLRLPFGWEAAPFLAQSMSTRLVRRATRRLRLSTPTQAFVYLDDVIIMSDNYDDAVAATDSVVRSFERAGFVLNMRKSVLTPTSSISALGYFITSPSRALTRVSPASPSLLLNAPAHLCNRFVTRRHALAVAGALLWAAPRVLPHLQPLYAHVVAHRRPTVFPRAVIQAVASAAYLAARDTWSMDRWEALPHQMVRDTLHPPTTIFCDASASRGIAACVSLDACTRRIWRLPAWLRADCADAQQDAELYGLCRTVLLALSRRVPHIVVSDSATALWAARRLSSGAFRPLRALLLRRLSECAHARPHHDIRFAYIRSENNPADPLTHARWSHRDVDNRLRRVEKVLPLPGRPGRSTLRSSAVISFNCQSSADRHVRFQF